MKKKMFIVVPVLVVIVAVVWYVSSTQWTRDFDLKCVDYVSDWETGNSYRIYEITNNSHRTLKDVSVIIEVEDILPGNWKYEDEVASSIRAGETVEYKLYSKDCEKAAEELGEQAAFVTSLEIVKIKYSK